MGMSLVWQVKKQLDKFKFWTAGGAKWKFRLLSKLWKFILTGTRTSALNFVEIYSLIWDKSLWFLLWGRWISVGSQSNSCWCTKAVDQDCHPHASMATNVKFAKVKQAFLNQWKIYPVGQENHMRLERRLGNYGLVKRNITNFSVPVSKAKHSFKHPVCPETEMWACSAASRHAFSLINGFPSRQTSLKLALHGVVRTLTGCEIEVFCGCIQ